MSKEFIIYILINSTMQEHFEILIFSERNDYETYEKGTL
jgi:hypothetical protein